MSVVKTTLNLDTELLEEVDAYAKRLHVNRTAAVKVLLARGLEQVKTIDGLQDFTNIMERMNELAEKRVLPLSE